MFYRTHPSPIGPLFITGDAAGLRKVLMEVDNHNWKVEQHWQAADNQLDEVCRQLDEYFSGQRRAFNLALAPVGTAFQQTVWAALQRINYGQTCSYSDIAQRIGRPQAVRAVGTANGANPISIIIPCHRVIGRNGALTGYAGGLPRKQWLLEREGVLQGAQHALALDKPR